MTNIRLQSCCKSPRPSEDDVLNGMKGQLRLARQTPSPSLLPSDSPGAPFRGSMLPYPSSAPHWKPISTISPSRPPSEKPEHVPVTCIFAFLTRLVSTTCQTPQIATDRRGRTAMRRGQRKGYRWPTDFSALLRNHGPTTNIPSRSPQAAVLGNLSDQLGPGITSSFLTDLDLQA